MDSLTTAQCERN